LISFDTNAWSKLLGGGGALERASLHHLRRKVKTRELRVAVSWPLIMELTGTFGHKRALWQKAVRQLKELGGGRILLERPARAQAEVRLGRRLRWRELFYPKRSSIRFFERVSSGENVQEEADHVARMKAEYETQESATQKAVRGEVGSTGRAEWVRAWRTDPDAIVDDWARDTIELISGSGKRDQDPRLLPSVWHRSAFHVARIYLVGVEGEGPGKIDGNDVMDHDHYVDAAYSGVLVTDDARLHRIAGQCPRPRVNVLRFREWAARLASG
jgi:hypothetical protein